MPKKYSSNNILLALASIFFALILFLTAYAANSRSGGSTTGFGQTYSHTLENVPIDIKYDSDKYFISGYSYEAEVYLTTTNRIKLDSETNEDTRHFKVVADLSNLSEGSHKVKLQLTNLPSEVSGEVSPQTMSVTIGKKKTKTFKVEGIVSPDQVASGYSIKEIKTGVTEAEVTSDEATINQIDHVVAVLPEEQTLSANYSKPVTLQAVSAEGKILPSIISPTKTSLSVKIAELSKTVPVAVEITGQLNKNVSAVTYELQTKEVTIYGKQTDLDKISKVTAKVDVSDVSKDTTKSVSLSADNVKVDPEKVNVKLTVKQK